MTAIWTVAVTVTATVTYKLTVTAKVTASINIHYNRFNYQLYYHTQWAGGDLY